MRQDFAEFEKRGAVIIVLGPNGPHAFKTYWEENGLPFIGLADVRSRVADQYAQEVNLLKGGRMPALFVVDKEGAIRYERYGDAPSDIPTTAEVTAVLDAL